MAEISKDAEAIAKDLKYELLQYCADELILLEEELALLERQIAEDIGRNM